MQVTKESRSVPPTSETNVDQPTPKTELDADPMSLVQLSEPKETEVLLMFAAAGMASGGIHCFVWSFPFSTHTEMILWRVSAIVAPVVVMFSDPFLVVVVIHPPLCMYRASG
ncbi:uncharacterized protein EI90DRAFT_3056947 [Cantharellus anzutake]|uniref:uncharacterized protein n=1 Tax=Cantharellus anzutake TaxID=1750568 RepID=UPI001904CDF9|nr:uncharacterized protein EI90DRAFT_3056947 [Cantharellus anzutake]KAF8331688.1 hypothetical protein EI90DRAFT_3056947 [Cantharellus anzutake]